MIDSAFPDDPVELRICLDVLEHNALLDEQAAVLGAEIALLKSEIAELMAGPPGDERPASEDLPHVDQTSPPEAKIALFRALFAEREDAYARRWMSAKTGKSGRSPAEPFGGRERPAGEREVYPLTDQVLAQHLARTPPGGRALHAGLMLSGDTCHVPILRMRRSLFLVRII